MEKLYDKIDEEVGIFTNVEGTGLYELQSKLNHSCQPNVQVMIQLHTCCHVTSDLHSAFNRQTYIVNFLHGRLKLKLRTLNFQLSCKC